MALKKFIISFVHQGAMLVRLRSPGGCQPERATRVDDPSTVRGENWRRCHSLNKSSDCHPEMGCDRWNSFLGLWASPPVAGGERDGGSCGGGLGPKAARLRQRRWEMGTKGKAVLHQTEAHPWSPARAGHQPVVWNLRAIWPKPHICDGFRAGL